MLLVNQGGLDARNPNQGIRMFRHGSRSFSRHVVCRSEVCAANHRRGDSFGVQCRLPVGRHGYKPSPNILIAYSGNTSQKVKLSLNIIRIKGDDKFFLSFIHCWRKGRKWCRAVDSFEDGVIKKPVSGHFFRILSDQPACGVNSE